MSANYISMFGRVLLSLIFLLSGLMKMFSWSETADLMASKGLPAVWLLLGAAAVIEIVGGLALLVGWHTRTAALLLFLYLIPVTLIFHNFWSVSGLEQQNQMFHFLKNLAIMGGLLEFYAVGAGLASLDARREGYFSWRITRFFGRMRGPAT